MSAAIQLHNDNDELKSMLKACMLFDQASAEAIEFASAHVERVTFNKGDCIILENEANNYVYFIAQGSVEIVSYLTNENRIQRLGLLKAGSNFAEFSILTKSARSGSAYAFEDCVLVRMEGSIFVSMLRAQPTISLRLVKHLSDLNLQVENYDEVVPLYQPSQLVIPAEILQYLPLAMCQKLGVIPVSYKAGLLTVLMKNPHAKEFYDYLGKSLPKTEICVHLISEAEFDVAFQTAQKSLKLALVPAGIPEFEEKSELNLISVLKSSRLFGEIKDEVLEQILQHVKPLSIRAGTHAHQPGQPIEAYYLIAKGTLQIHRPLSQTPAVATVMTLSAGDGFGEVQLMSEGPCGYFARALTDTVLLPIPANIIKQLLKLPTFSIHLATSLAQRLQMMGHSEGLHYFKPKGELDFKAVAHLLPVTLMEHQKIMPLQIKDHEVLLGIVHSDTAEVVSLTRRYLQDHRVKVYGITEDQFKTWYPQLRAQIISPAEKAPANTHALHPHAKLDVVKWIDHILQLGMNNRASDIHFEPTFDHLIVRFRIDGVLQEHNERLPIETGKEIISRLKIISDMDISQFHLPQDGQLKVSVGKVQIMARASSIPIRNGEKIVLRLIRSQGSVVPLAMLAADRRVLNILNSVTHCQQGLFLVTGPTGSGKTTTLYSMLNAINDIGVNVTTLEDPIEMEITGFNQIEMDRKRGLDFNLALRSVLRQDPNVIMVGEIRDQESAKIVMDASITGHLVLSTLHTNSALDVAPRLSELGISPATLASGLLGVLSQRLLRANCKKCLTSRPSLASEKEYFHQILPTTPPPEEIHYSVGCPACGNTGYRHRIPVFEVWRNTPAMRRGLLEKCSSDELMALAREDGFETLLEAGLKLVFSRIVSLEEVRRVLSSI